ncbi:MAG: hypothetical protein HKM95_07485 [Inquilinus sp.]|nr:hypothetical protein [Inquilinus sp.]
MSKVIRRSFRRDFRNETPSLALQIGDDVVHSRDWSIGGFSIYDMHRLSIPCMVEDVICGTLGRDRDIPRYEFTATVVRLEPQSNMMACKFIDMSNECFSFLEQLLRHTTRARDLKRSRGGKS